MQIIRREQGIKNNMLTRLLTIVIGALVLSLGACSNPDMKLPAEHPQDSYAIDSLQATDNGTYELDEEALAGIVMRIEKGYYGNFHSLIIIHNNGLALEKYFKGWTRHMHHPCYSMTKSFTSALIGIAVKNGFIKSVDENLLSFFPEYEGQIANLDDRKKAITIKDVLTMSAGFQWDELSTSYVDRQGNPNLENDAMKMAQSDDWIKYMLDLPMSTDPSTEFVYNSGCTILLSGILSKTTGKSAEQLAAEQLFSPLGITSWEWETAPHNITNTGWGLSMHPANMAIFGYLFLKSGGFAGEQLVPEQWVQECSEKHITIGSMPWPMTGMFDYGYQWWRFNDLFFDKMWRGDPPAVNDIFFASGWGGQKTFVIQDLDMVITVTAWNPTNEVLTGLLFNDCLLAVKEK
jgi:CubicO group peptidase (beta-lactamase class C family)